MQLHPPATRTGFTLLELMLALSLALIVSYLTLQAQQISLKLFTQIRALHRLINTGEAFNAWFYDFQHPNHQLVDASRLLPAGWCAQTVKYPNALPSPYQWPNKLIKQNRLGSDLLAVVTPVLYALKSMSWSTKRMQHPLPADTQFFIGQTILLTDLQQVQLTTVKDIVKQSTTNKIFSVKDGLTSDKQLFAVTLAINYLFVSKTKRHYQQDQPVFAFYLQGNRQRRAEYFQTIAQIKLTRQGNQPEQAQRILTLLNCAETPLLTIPPTHQLEVIRSANQHLLCRYWPIYISG